MNPTGSQTEPSMDSRDALDMLASLPIDELRRLAARLDAEGKIVRSVLRERTRRPARGFLLEADA